MSTPFPELDVTETNIGVLVASVSRILRRLKEQYREGKWSLVRVVSSNGAENGDCILTVYVDEENAWTVRDLVQQDIAQAQEHGEIAIALIVQPMDGFSASSTFAL